MLNLDTVKKHLNVSGDQDDDIIQIYADAATEWCLSYTGAAYDDPSTAPANMKLAALMLAAHFYQNREASLVGVTAQELPNGVLDRLNPLRSWSFWGADDGGE